jgi:hypothetical protein
MRDGRSRIYYRRSHDNGVTWDGPAAGQALLPNVSYGDYQCFHPSVACTTATGVVGCSFYVFGNWFGSSYRIQRYSVGNPNDRFLGKANRGQKYPQSTLSGRSHGRIRRPKADVSPSDARQAGVLTPGWFDGVKPRELTDRRCYPEM